MTEQAPQTGLLSDADLGIVSTKKPAETPTATLPDKSVLSDADLGMLSARPDLRPTYDVPKSALSAVERLPIGMVNAPADLLNFVSKAIENGIAATEVGAVKLYNAARGDTDTPEGKARIDFVNKAVEMAGSTNEKTRPYSTQEISQAIDPYAKQVLPVGPAYQSQTSPGKFTQTAIDVMGPGMFGKGKLAEKFIRGAGSLVGVEASDKAADMIGLTDPTTRTALGILGAIAGGVGGEAAIQGTRVVGKILDPSEAANIRIAQAIKLARDNDRAPTDQEIQDASAAQKPMTVYDVTGGQDQQLIAPNVTGPAREAARKINDFITQRGEQAADRVNSNLNEILGKDIDAGQTKENISAQQKVDNDINYKKALNDPMAGDVESPFVQSVIGNPLAEDAIKKATKELGGYSNNLKYWDQVKQNLDDSVNEAYKKGQNNFAERLKDLRDGLRDDLVSQNPEYGVALNGASSFFKAKNALQAGYNYALNFNTFDAAGARKALANYDAGNFGLFQEGFVSALQDKAKGGVDKLLTGIDKTASVGKLNDVFPSENGTQARQIQTMVDLENMTRDVQRIELGANLADSAKPGLGRYLVGIASATPGVFAGLTTSSTAVGAGVGLSGWLVNKAAQGTISLAQRRVATQVAETLASGDKNGILELSKLAETTPAVKSTIEKLKPFLNQTLLTMTGVNAANANPRQQRASGGSVIDKAADKLVSESMRNQKLLAHHTEQMLSMPDDAIVQALHVARSVAAQYFSDARMTRRGQRFFGEVEPL